MKAIKFVKHDMRSGFFMIDLMVALVVLLWLAGILSRYSSVISAQYQQSINQVDSSCMAENCLYEKNKHSSDETKMRIMSFSSSDHLLACKGYTRTFHEYFECRQAIVKVGARSISLATLVDTRDKQ